MNKKALTTNTIGNLIVNGQIVGSGGVTVITSGSFAIPPSTNGTTFIVNSTVATALTLPPQPYVGTFKVITMNSGGDDPYLISASANMYGTVINGIGQIFGGDNTGYTRINFDGPSNGSYVNMTGDGTNYYFDGISNNGFYGS